MVNKYQMEMQNFSDNLVTSPLIFSMKTTARADVAIFLPPFQRECNFIYLLCLYLNWLNILCKLRPTARLPVASSRRHWTEATLLAVRHSMEQGVIDSAIDEWRRRIRACVWTKWDISSKRCENINNLLNSNVSTCISLKLCKICVILKSWICGSCGFFSDELFYLVYFKSLFRLLKLT